MVKERKPLIFGVDRLKRKEEPVQIGDQNFVLRQAMAGDIIAYKNFMSRAMKVDPSKKTAQMEGYYDSEVFLICTCLVEITDKGEKLVSGNWVKKLPQDIHEALFNRAKELSGIDQEFTEEELLDQKRDIDDRLATLRKANKSQTNGFLLGNDSDEENQEIAETASVVIDGESAKN